MGSFLHSQQFTASCIRTHQLKDAASQYVFLLHRLLRSFTKLLLYWRARVTPYIFVSVIYYQDLARKQHLGGSSDHKISCFRVYNTWISSLKNFKCTIRNILIFVQLPGKVWIKFRQNISMCWSKLYIYIVVYWYYIAVRRLVVL